jgi:hypothetical protein
MRGIKRNNQVKAIDIQIGTISEASSNRLTFNGSLKTEDIEATVKFFNDRIHWGSWNVTPQYRDTRRTQLP